MEADVLQRSYQTLIDSEMGRRVLADIEARSYMRETSFTPDAQRTAFNEGRRSLALHIVRMATPPGRSPASVLAAEG